MNQIIKQSFDVHYSYPVIFTRGMWNTENASLADALRDAVDEHPQPLLLIYIDSGVAAAMPELTSQIASYIQRHMAKVRLVAPPIIVPGGEVAKSNRAQLNERLHEMTEARLDRHSFVMVIGGGAVLDAVGYAASLVHRGVRMVRVPTTVLGQNDGGVGVKTAINDAAGKNFFGTFAPPFAVINDSEYFRTLPDDEWRSGIAEAYKVAMIKDAVFFDWLTQVAGHLFRRDIHAMEILVYRCAELHLNHIRSSGDPFEMGIARPLDFGHWSAHELEAMTHFAIGHGHAVAIGIMIDTLYAKSHQWLANDIADALYAGLTNAGFHLWHDALAERNADGRLRVLSGLDRFREHLGGDLCITMPADIGKSINISEIDEERLETVIHDLRTRIAQSAASTT